MNEAEYLMKNYGDRGGCDWTRAEYKWTHGSGLNPEHLLPL